MVKGLQMMKCNKGSYLKRVSKQTLAEFSIMRQENEAREMNLITKLEKKFSVMGKVLKAYMQCSCLQCS